MRREGGILFYILDTTHFMGVPPKKSIPQNTTIEIFFYLRLNYRSEEAILFLKFIISESSSGQAIRVYEQLPVVLNYFIERSGNSISKWQKCHYEGRPVCSACTGRSPEAI
ncbi:MAG: hypothetical protein HY578_06685 [Nitrospinae bacterium]|nr:hypothetical protein [Nitrospinota bacterium]